MKTLHISMCLFFKHCLAVKIILNLIYFLQQVKAINEQKDKTFRFCTVATTSIRKAMLTN